MILSLFYYYSSSYSRICSVRVDLESAMESETSKLFLFAEDYLDELVDAIRQHETRRFRERLLEPDVLFLDGIDVALRGKEASQEELYYLLRKRHELKKKTVLFACVSPEQLEKCCFTEQLIALIRDGQIGCLDEA